MAVLGRFLVALVVVFATYNPEGVSYYHWLRSGQGSLPLKAFLGVVLLIGWAFLLNSARESLGAVGIVLAAAFFGTLLWLAVSALHFAPRGSRAFSYLVELALAGVLSVGLGWSKFRHGATGQVDVD